MLSLVVSSTGYASVAPLAAVQQRAASPTMFGKAELEGAHAACDERTDAAFFSLDAYQQQFIGRKQPR